MDLVRPGDKDMQSTKSVDQIYSGPPYLPKKIPNISLIPVFYKLLGERDNKNKDLKANIYHLALKTILQYKYHSSTGIELDTNNILGNSWR